MSFRGMLIKAGIDSNGTDIAIFDGYLKLQKANIMYFRDTHTYIYSNAEGELTIYARDELHIDIPAVDFDGGFACTGAVVDAFVISGTESDNGIEITGVAQGAGILINYALPTTASRGIEVLTSSTSVAAGTSVLPIHMLHTVGADGGVGHRAEFHTRCNYAAGPWINALKGYMEFDNAAGNGTAGRTTGLASAICAEMLMPDAAPPTGSYFPLEVEFVGQTNSGTGVTHGFVTCRASGTLTNFDASGFFLDVQGLTAGATAMLSLTSQTLKSYIGANTRYLVLSQMQDGLGLGIDGTPMVLAAEANHAIDVWTTTPATTNTVWAASINAASTVGGCNIGSLSTVLSLGADHGGWAIGQFVQLDYNNFTATHGMGAAACFEILLPNHAAAGGEYHVIALELAEAGTDYGSMSALGLPTSFIKFETYGAGSTEIDDHGYLFFVHGLAPAATKLLSLDSQTLRLNVNSLERFLMLSRAENVMHVGTSADPTILEELVPIVAAYGAVGASSGTGTFFAARMDLEIEAGVDLSTSVAATACFNKMTLFGTGTDWSSDNVCAGAIGSYNTDGNAVAVTNGIHSGLCAWMFAGDNYSLVWPAEYCGLSIITNTHASATIASYGHSAIMVMKGSGAAQDMGNIMKIHGNTAANFLQLYADDTMVTATAATAGCRTLTKKIKIMIDDATYYLLATTDPG